MPRLVDLQTSFTAGEFDELLALREDVRFYKLAASKVENCVILPQGGATKRGALAHKARCRKRLVELEAGEDLATAPNGGTLANAFDGDAATSFTTSAVGTTDPFVVIQLDFLGPQEIEAVDVINLKIGSATVTSLDDEMFWQWSNDASSWTNIGEAMNITDQARSRRRAVDPNGAPLSARYLRLVRVGATDLSTSTLTLTGVRVWLRGADYGNVRLIPFSFSNTVEYELVLTDQNLDIFEDGAWRAAAYIPHLDADLPRINFAQSLDTLLLFHQDHAPQRVFRQGSDDEWDFRDQPFKNVPEYQFGDSGDTGGENEKQQITFGSMSAGDDFTLELDGELTDPIEWSATAATNVTNIQNALRALDNTSADGIVVANPTGTEYTVEFTGDDGKLDWPLLVSDRISGTGTIDISVLNEGKPDQQPAWSATKGYPSCGTFYQGRLYLAGFKSLPQHVAASVAADFFNFKDGDADDAGLFFSADTDQIGRIWQLFPGRHLQVFTEIGEFYLPSEPITPTNLAMKQTSRLGIYPGPRVEGAEGATLFVQAGGNTLREYTFDFAEDNYNAEPISLLAPHLVREPSDVALRLARNTRESDLYFIINSGLNDDGDGFAPAAVLTTLRSQNVTAFGRFTTPGGRLKTVAAKIAGDIFFVVERTLAEGRALYLEKWDTSQFLDAGGVWTNPDYSEVTATAGQKLFVYTFTSPASADDLAVWVRSAGTGPYVKIDESQYSVNLGTKQVTLTTGRSAGDVVRVNKRVSSITVDDHLYSQTIQHTVDGWPAGDTTVSAGGTLTLNEVKADFSIGYGLHFDAELITLPAKPQLPDGTVVGRKLRVPRVTLSLYRTGQVSIAANGRTPRNLPLRELGGNLLDKDFDYSLFTGEKTIAGLKGWDAGGKVHIKCEEPVPFTVRGLAYWVGV